MNVMAEKKENAFSKYIKGVKSELKKVTWPSFKQVCKNTWTVVACVVIVGLFIFILDAIFGFGFQSLIK